MTHADERTWWAGFAPDEMVEAFDACARTGVGPTERQGSEAFALLFERFHEIADELERGGDRNPSIVDDVGEPSLGLHLLFRHRYGWATPSGEALDAIARDHAGETVVEIGCGSGYATACLRARRLAVTAVNAPEGACRWKGWWRHKFVDDVVERMASGIDYSARTYLMVMPDRNTDGEDMMAEALSRMPVGATIYLHAPPEYSGSRRGNAILDWCFEDRGRLPMFETVPNGEGEPGVLRRMAKVREVRVDDVAPEPARAVPAFLKGAGKR